MASYTQLRAEVCRMSKFFSSTRKDEPVASGENETQDFVCDYSSPQALMFIIFLFKGIPQRSFTAENMYFSCYLLVRELLKRILTGLQQMIKV